MKNREIKFRAYHNGAKEMLYGDNISIFNWLKEGQPVEIMQYTGLKDKNGKEIYESDILKCQELIVVIEFNGGQFVGISKQVSQELQNRNWFQFEVIGNIYENKDLIK